MHSHALSVSACARLCVLASATWVFQGTSLQAAPGDRERSTEILREAPATPPISHASSSSSYSPPPSYTPPPPPPSSPPSSSGGTSSSATYQVSDPYQNQGTISNYSSRGSYDPFNDRWSNSYSSGFSYSRMRGDPFWDGYFYSGGRYHAWGGYSYSPWGDAYWNNMPVYRPADLNTPNTGYYFPPNPPPLGVPPPKASRGSSNGAAPAELAPYIGEVFYPQLAKRLALKKLPEKLKADIEAYRSDRDKERTELKARIEAAAKLPAEARREALTSFALEQTPRLLALEVRAEQFRTDLLRKGLPGLILGSFNWFSDRDWRLGEDTRNASKSTRDRLEFILVRASAYYHEGLTVTQRRLLREAAMDLQVEGNRRPTPASARLGLEESETLCFFGPETAQIIVPESLSAEVQDKLNAYQAERKAVKAELVSVLLKDDEKSQKRRAGEFAKLAEQQAARLGTLEVLADDIRKDLADKQELFRSNSAPTIPAEISKRLRAYLKEKEDLSSSLRAKLEEFNAKRTDLSEGPPSRDKTSPREAKTIAMIRFNREQSPRYDALRKEYKEIKDLIAEHLAEKGIDSKVKSPGAVLRQLETSLRNSETWPSFQDAYAAIFQVGLSAEQRRLLHDASIEDLKIPLPRGE